MAKCPNCGREGVKYVKSRSRLWKGRSSVSKGASTEPRTDFQAKCRKCKWSGILEP